MSNSVDPGVVIAGIFAMFIAITVGIPLASARTGAALPMLGSCPGQLWNFIVGNPISIAATTECAIGGMIFLAIPGAIGVGLMVFRTAQ